MHEPVDDDRPYIETRFRTAVRPLVRGYRASPWHALEPFEAPPLDRKARLRAVWERSRLFHLGQRVGDTLVGWRDAWRRRGNRRPTHAAQEEWWEYYRGLYQAHAPDVERFDRLLRRRGAPDWVNPHSFDDMAHYDYHPAGLMMADAEAVLRGVRLRWMGATSDPEADARIAQLGQLATACMGLALARAKALPILKAEIAEENLALIAMEAARAPLRPHGVTPQNVLDGAVRLGWVSPASMALLRPLLMSLSTESEAPSSRP